MFKKGIVLLMGVLGLGLGGCCSQKLVCYDEFSGSTTRLSKPSYVNAGGLKSVELQAYVEKDRFDQESYGFIAKVYRPIFDEFSARPANILEGDSLSLLIDGRTYTYSTVRGGTKKSTITPGLICGYYEESARYPNVPRADLIQLANAGEAKIKVETEEGDYVATIGPKLSSKIASFVYENLREDSQEIADVSIP